MALACDAIGLGVSDERQTLNWLGGTALQRNLLKLRGYPVPKAAGRRFRPVVLQKPRGQAPMCTWYWAPVDKWQVPVPWYGVVIRYSQFMKVPR